MLGGSFGYTSGKVLGSDKAIKMKVYGTAVLGTILGDVYGITLCLYVETKPRSLDEYFDGLNDGKIEGSFIGGSNGSTYDRVFGFDEGIKLELSHGIVLGTILVNIDGITFGVYVGTEIGSLD